MIFSRRNAYLSLHPNISEEFRGTLRCLNFQINKWIDRNWESAKGYEIVIRDDFEELLDVMQGIRIRWKYVPAHTGIYGNEMADQLANEGMEYM